jgi:hypothetical protein
MKVMQKLGYKNYQDVMKHGISAGCPICPHPNKNMKKEDWDQELHA